MNQENSPNKEDSSLWYKILDLALMLPGARVNRDEFLKSEFANTYSGDMLAQVLERGPAMAGVPLSSIETAAKRVIKNHRIAATGVSALAGIPGGWSLLGTIPADMAHYYYHALLVNQKLAYLYGYPDLVAEGDEEFKAYVTLFVGAMIGDGPANQVIKAAARELVKEAFKLLPSVALAKIGFRVIIKDVAVRVGIRLTKQVAARSVSKMVPVVGAITSGGLTYVLFGKEANKLNKSFRKAVSEAMREAPQDAAQDDAQNDPPEPVQEAAQEDAPEPVQEAAQEDAPAPVQEDAQEAAQEPAQEASHDAAQSATSDAPNDTTSDATHDATPDATQDATPDATQDATPDAAPEPQDTP
jgi:hypothetical protein